ncbi:RipA family octameric membrane protein [Streptomyces pseudovenezuelae]|uniref:RipA family octameric membrane protein n=1 Tax=Streptomyces pseudovenezuelae TaxID=67350 RepID=UPI0036E85A68
MGESGNGSGDNPSLAQQQAQDARLWEHGLHESNMFFQRGNLFLLAHSLIIVGYSTLLSARGQGDQGHQAMLAARGFSAFGIALSLTWLYVDHRHLRYTKLVQERAMARLPEYAETRAQWPQARIASVPMIGYGLPAMACAMWVFLLFAT